MSVFCSLNRKSYCNASNSNETLAESAAKNGGVPKFPGKLEALDEPTERVQAIVEQIMNITFFESAQLGTLSPPFLRFSALLFSLHDINRFI